ncbi:MAG TPA: zinc finger domain-containing protein [Nitrososphaerales archaeon]
MSETRRNLHLPSCTSCNRPIMPNEKSSKFQCPECGNNILWRCEKCRTFSREYRCVNCGFEGP